jgi:ABC-type multidrug transport system fused ATPase/permease subunit
MRKLLKINTWLSLTLWVITILVGGLALTMHTQLADVIFKICLTIGMLYMIFTVVMSCTWTASGLDRDWFKTQDELQTSLDETRKSWQTAEKLVKILGEHEAVKLWNAEKEKEKQNELQPVS